MSYSAIRKSRRGRQNHSRTTGFRLSSASAVASGTHSSMGTDSQHCMLGYLLSPQRLRNGAAPRAYGGSPERRQHPFRRRNLRRNAKNLKVSALEGFGAWIADATDLGFGQARRTPRRGFQKNDEELAGARFCARIRPCPRRRRFHPLNR
jgi:hypothetical protein